MSCADIALEYINTSIIYVAAWLPCGHHGEIYRGVYMYYARMRPFRSRYRLESISSLTVPDSSLAPRKV